MKQKVMIKSNRYGLIVYMDPDSTYPEILDEIKLKFSESAKFFEGAHMAITFEGHALTKVQETEIIENITDLSGVTIVCIFDNNENTERIYQRIVRRNIEDLPRREGQFYRGTLKKRQVLESEKSIIVLGDVEYGATVISKGNIIVLGTIRGNVHAGASGNKNAFVVALAFKPHILRIADVSDEEIYVRKSEHAEAKIAWIDDEQIRIDPLKDQNW